MPEILSLDFNDNHSLAPNAKRIGELGETLAARFLVKNGYRLVVANFKIPIGRNSRGAAVTGEIDLIAIDDDVLCFVEVKTRSSDDFAAPIAAVDLRKQRQIIRTARMYRKTFQIDGVKFRYDAVGIVLRKDSPPEFALFKNFWNENKFRKKIWADEI